MADFVLATALMDHPAEQVRISYEGATLKGYLYAPDHSGRPRVVSQDVV